MEESIEDARTVDGLTDSQQSMIRFDQAQHMRLKLSAHFTSTLNAAGFIFFHRRQILWLPHLLQPSGFFAKKPSALVTPVTGLPRDSTLMTPNWVHM
ncbi:TPA: hypothetical protein ACH3X1_010728 [Trebouxia sp. C0004]